MGRARGFRLVIAGESTIPVGGLDYFFITSAGVQKRIGLRFELTPEGGAELADSQEGRDSQVHTYALLKD